ncbi:unnamed protein product [Orchesella dallaii]|uniref:Uncharacterized protein n=1 Tax=Orchesella dallaii TaxID=48710 RepID=A0ABP1RUK7_9HEXA
MNSEILQVPIMIKALDRTYMNRLKAVITQYNHLLATEANNNLNLFQEMAKGPIRLQLLTAHLAQELNRLTNALFYAEVRMSCSHRKLSQLLVSPSILRRQLQLLRVKLMAQQHELVVPGKTLTPYYELALATCQISAVTKTITIVLQVPVKRHAQHFALFQIIAIPFQRRDRELCRLHHDYSTVVMMNNVAPIIVEGAQARTCSYDSQACFFDEYSWDPSPSALCANALLRGVTIAEVQQLCSFTCHHFSHNTVVITELENRYYALSNIHIELTTHCFSGSVYSTEPVKISGLQLIPGSTGAYLLHLPCSCTLMDIEGNTLIVPPVLCREDGENLLPHVHLVLPYMWSTLDRMTLVKSTTLMAEISSSVVYPDLSNLLNISVSSEVFTKDSIVRIGNESFGFHAHLIEYHQTYHNYAQILFNVVMCILVFYLYVRLQQTQQAVPLLYSLIHTPRSVEGLCPDLQSYHSYLAFWVTLVVIDVFLIVMMLTILFCFCKRRWMRQAQAGRFAGGVDCTYASAPREMPYLPRQETSFREGEESRGHYAASNLQRSPLVRAPRAPRLPSIDRGRGRARLYPSPHQVIDEEHPSEHPY